MIILRLLGVYLSISKVFVVVFEKELKFNPYHKLNWKGYVRNVFTVFYCLFLKLFFLNFIINKKGFWLINIWNLPNAENFAVRDIPP